MAKAKKTTKKVAPAVEEAAPVTETKPKKTKKSDAPAKASTLSLGRSL